MTTMVSSSGSTSSMAVGTHYFTLFDLRQDERPASSATTNSLSNLKLLLDSGEVIKVQNNGISLPAVDAGGLREQLPILLKVLLAMRSLCSV